MAIRGKWEDHEGLRVYLGKSGLSLGSRTAFERADESLVVCMIGNVTIVGRLSEGISVGRGFGEQSRSCPLRSKMVKLINSRATARSRSKYLVSPLHHGTG